MLASDIYTVTRLLLHSTFQCGCCPHPHTAFLFENFFEFFLVSHHLNCTFKCADNCAGEVIFGDTVQCVDMDNNHNKSCYPHIVVVW